jgi:EAL domain-containing protein (putative c-di-GMP-specific phosphodiesterase class I)
MGIALAIDDFGTGYSSLSRLRHLPVSELKIDKSFVLGMSKRDADMVIVRSTIDLGHNLGLTVTAEGIETAETLEMLKTLGCDRAQGYLLAKPLSPEDLVAWIEAGTPVS